MLHLHCHVAGVPVNTRVIQSEIEFHPITVRQTQKQVKQVDRRRIAPFSNQICRRICDKLSVSATNHYNGVDPYCLHIAEIRVPLLLAPVLVRDIVRNLVQESAGDSKRIVIHSKQRHSLVAKTYASLQALRHHTSNAQCRQTFYKGSSIKHFC